MRQPATELSRRSLLTLAVLAAATGVLASPAQAGNVVYDDISSIYTLPDTGGTLTLITQGGSWGMPSSPRWSPGGTRIAFVARAASASCTMDQAGCSSEIGVMNADGTARTLITSSGGARNSDPTWTPDGTRIVFLRGGGQSPKGIVAASDIWSIAADGTGEKRLTKTTVPEGSPHVRSDGRIDFEVWPPNESVAEVDAINADGTARVRLIQGDFAVYSYAYSNDGLKIAWGGQLNFSPPSSIYTMSADGTLLKARTQLYGRWGGGAQVTWSDDATAVMYRGTVAPGSDNDPPNLFRLDLTTGAAPLNLTGYPRPAPPGWPSPTVTGDPSNPDWQGPKGAVASQLAARAAAKADRRAPYPRLLGVKTKTGTAYARSLRYSVIDRSGIRSVRVAASVRSSGKCRWATTTRLRSGRCSRPVYVKIAGSRAFHKLASRLPKGKAVFRFRTVDVRGNHTKAPQIRRVRIIG